MKIYKGLQCLPYHIATDIPPVPSLHSSTFRTSAVNMPVETRSGSSKQRGTGEQHGLPTPDATPAPDKARLDADNQRRSQEQPNLSPVLEDSSQGSGISSSESGSESESDDEPLTPQPIQIEAVNQVLACRPQEWRKILAVEPNSDRRLDKQNIMNIFRKLGYRTNPRLNKAPGAEKAHNSTYCSRPECVGKSD